MAITLSGTAITMNDNSTLVSTTTHLAIGSYATLALGQNGGSVGVGATVAGTSLRYSVGNSFPIATATSNDGSGTSASGTWRNMSGAVNNSLATSGGGEQPTVYRSQLCLSARIS